MTVEAWVAVAVIALAVALIVWKVAFGSTVDRWRDTRGPRVRVRLRGHSGRHHGIPTQRQPGHDHLPGGHRRREPRR